MRLGQPRQFGQFLETDIAPGVLLHELAGAAQLRLAIKS
ncbi:hypothetical protein LPU83_pLPU83d_1593 (plasmid) [Rhizobium favelukesii]|uniref:Uncharacterized protein n=1 Tax=Rhizobium favelukesii TaxID=348824 RepID=W6RWJ6_9HYPH|nr:hypothetical protein LPU83_pLPU83d_1593 [Rhizobium favelukesii]